MKLLSTTAVMLAIAGSALAVDAETDFPIIQGFDRYSNGIYEANSIDLKGRAHLPSDMSSPVPLLIFFHGSGERGTQNGYDNTSQVEGNIQHLFNAAVANGWMVYAPQTYNGWGVDQTDMAMAALGQLVTDYNVDTSRIYVSGLSLGGGATWTALSQYREVFAAGVPVAGVNTTGSGWAFPARMTETPIWAFHADNDGTVNVSSSRSMVNNIRAADGKGPWTFGDGANTGSPYYSDGSRYYEDGLLRYSEYDGGGHGIWNRAYQDSINALYPWMLAQTNEVPTLQEGQTVRVNAGYTSLDKFSQVDGAYWNSATYGIGQTQGVVRSFLRTDDTNHNTTLMLDITAKFDNDTGATNTAQVNESAWVKWSSVTAAEMVIHGLTPGGEYDLEFFSSSTSYAGTSPFGADGQTVDLVYTNNVDDTAWLQGVHADGDGNLAITVVGAEGGSFGILNWFGITAVTIPEPASAMVLGLGALALLRRR